MGLSDLTLPSMEHYGGIELKQNARKYLTSAFGASVGLHALLILIYFTWTALAAEDEKAIPRIRIRSIAELAPPPSTTEEQQEAVPLQAIPPAGDMAKPNFGIPVPVPDAIAPTAVMPDLNTVPTGMGTSEVGSAAEVVGGGGTVQLEVKQPVVEDDPDRDAFISVEAEPVPIVNIQTLVEYPEVAKRAGLEGKVVVSALIGKDGRVEKVEIDKSDFEVFEKAARDAMMKAKFTPARQNGQPVKVWFTVPLVFKLNQR